MGNNNLKPFFDPRSVAVVGASDKPGKISNIIVRSLKAAFPGPIYPVNPKYTSVEGLKCYPSVQDIDGKVDLAIYALPAGATPDAIRSSSGKVGGAILVSGGFAEAGESGRALEKELKETARHEGIRIIGPNCMGIYDNVSRLDTFFISTERIRRPAPGGVSIISQSGSFAITAMDELASEGVGVARVISYGNRMDVNESDCLEFLADDPATTAVALYIESVEDGRRFVEAAKRCSSKKPVMAVKVGKYGAGARAALSHTGAMAGRLEVYRAAFKKAGVVELAGYEDFLAGCKVFGKDLRPEGNRVMIITDGGGMGVEIADACLAMGLEVPPLTEDVKEAIAPLFPQYFAIGNPIDLTGSATDDMFAQALEKAMSSDGFDIAIVAALWGPPALTDDLPELLSEKAVFTGKPVIICSPGGEYTRQRLGLFRKFGFPVFTTPEGAVRGAAALARNRKRADG
ncbi:MAG: acetate--CoA ligase family protein [Deltaproteobacteria bacterium]|nr:acetate--CoA ligase family protein [Deltaproteobacteria bacterium]